MKLEEAIKELGVIRRVIYASSLPLGAKALKLGIEALKWRLLMEHDYGSWCGPPLPGETKD